MAINYKDIEIDHRVEDIRLDQLCNIIDAIRAPFESDQQAAAGVKSLESEGSDARSGYFTFEHKGHDFLRMKIRNFSADSGMATAFLTFAMPAGFEKMKKQDKIQAVNSEIKSLNFVDLGCEPGYLAAVPGGGHAATARFLFCKLDRKPGLLKEYRLWPAGKRCDISTQESMRLVLADGTIEKTRETNPGFEKEFLTRGWEEYQRRTAENPPPVELSAAAKTVIFNPRIR